MSYYVYASLEHPSLSVRNIAFVGVYPSLKDAKMVIESGVPNIWYSITRCELLEPPPSREYKELVRSVS